MPEKFTLEQAYDREKRFLAQVYEAIRAIVKEETAPLRAVAEQLARDHYVLLMQSEHTANTVASMNTHLVRLQSWATGRGGHEDRMDARIKRLLESVERVLPGDPTPTPPNGGLDT